MVYKISEFAKIVGVSPLTLRNWDIKGKLVAFKTVSGYRYYTEKHLEILEEQQSIPIQRK